MRGRVVVHLCGVALVLAFAASRPALAADPAPSPAPQDVDAAVTNHYNAGMRAAKAGQWEQAREAFLQAWTLKPHFQIASNLGRAELMAGRYRDAAEHLRYFLREAPAKLAASQRKETQRLLAEALVMLAKAQAKIGAVTVEVDVEGADISVDGTALGPSPLAEPVFVEPGRHVFEAKRQGNAVVVPLDVTAGSTPKVTLQLGKEPPAATEPQPGAAKPSAVTSAPAPTAPAAAKVTPERKHTGRSPRWKPWAIGGSAVLAATGVGLGIGLTVASNSKGNDALNVRDELKRTTSSGQPICLAGSPAQNKASCDALADALDDRDGYRTGAIVGYAIGGTAAIGTVILMVLPRRALGRSTGLRVTPLLSPIQSGALITGSF